MMFLLWTSTWATSLLGVWWNGWWSHNIYVDSIWDFVNLKWKKDYSVKWYCINKVEMLWDGTFVAKNCKYIWSNTTLSPASQYVTYPASHTYFVPGNVVCIWKVDFDNNIKSYECVLPNYDGEYSFLDYSKLDYSKLDYSKLDYSRINYNKIDYSKLDYSRINYNKIDYSKIYNKIASYASLQSFANIKNKECNFPGKKISIKNSRYLYCDTDKRLYICINNWNPTYYSVSGWQKYSKTPSGLWRRRWSDSRSRDGRTHKGHWGDSRRQRWHGPKRRPSCYK